MEDRLAAFIAANAPLSGGASFGTQEGEEEGESGSCRERAATGSGKMDRPRSVVADYPRPGSGGVAQRANSRKSVVSEGRRGDM